MPILAHFAGKEKVACVIFRHISRKNTEKTQKKLEFTKTLHRQSCIASGYYMPGELQVESAHQKADFFFWFPHFCRPPIGISIPSAVGCRRIIVHRRERQEGTLAPLHTQVFSLARSRIAKPCELLPICIYAPLLCHEESFFVCH